MSNAQAHFEKTADSLEQAGDDLRKDQQPDAGADLEEAAEHTRLAAHRLTDMETIIRANAGMMRQLQKDVKLLKGEMEELKKRLPPPGES